MIRKNIEKREAIQWSFLILALLFLMFTMYYADIKVTYLFGFSFLDALFDGNILEFYQYALNVGVAPEGAVYDILIYLVFAIWGLPIWILHKFFQFDYLAVGCMLWFKILLVVFVFGSMALVKKIALLLKYSEKVCFNLYFYYFSSMFIILPVFVIAQYDIIPLFFVLLGMLFYMQNDKKRFLIYFAVAMAMKPFAALMFVPLVLLKEKKISRIILQGLAGFSLFLLCKVFYLPSEAYRNSGASFLSGMSYKLFEVAIPAGSGNVSLFCAGIVAICIIAYFIRDEKKEDNRIAILISFSVWAVFVLFVNICPYWAVYLAPFLLLVVFMNPARLNICLILELIMGGTMTVAMAINYAWVVGGSNTFADLIFRTIYKNQVVDSVMSVGELLEKYKVIKLLPAINAAMMVSTLALLLIAIKGFNIQEDAEKEDIWHKWIRIAMIYAWIILCLFLFVLGCQ